RRKAARERFADPSAFAVLGDLSMLEDLEVMDGLPLTPEHLAFLRFLKLRSLWICEVDLRSPAMIDALKMAPDLRSLRLSSAAVSADLLRALRALRLERLDLLACRGFDDAAWPAIADLRTLRSLEITCVRSEMPEHQQLGDAAFDAFMALPGLLHLGLDETEFPGDLLARLPAKLESLDLGDRPMDAGAARSLRRLTALRTLTFGCGLDDDAAAAVLPSWSLERLDYRGNTWSKKLLDA